MEEEVEGEENAKDEEKTDGEEKEEEEKIQTKNYELPKGENAIRISRRSAHGTK